MFENHTPFLILLFKTVSFWEKPGGSWCPNLWEKGADLSLRRDHERPVGNPEHHRCGFNTVL